MAYHLTFSGLGYVAQHGSAWRWRFLNVPEEHEGGNGKSYIDG